jgi:hypothetical protein
VSGEKMKRETKNLLVIAAVAVLIAATLFKQKVLR